MRTIILLALSAAAFAKDKPVEPKPPAITDAMRATFWKASFERAVPDANYSAAIETMAKACAERKQLLTLDQSTREPTCADPLKPAEAPKPAETPKADHAK